MACASGSPTAFPPLLLHEGCHCPDSRLYERLTTSLRPESVTSLPPNVPKNEYSCHAILVRSHARRERRPRVCVQLLACRFIFLLSRSPYLFFYLHSPPSPAAQPPHRLSSIDDPYALASTLSASASPRQSVASSLNASPNTSYARIEHQDDPDHPAMPLNNAYGQQQQGYTNVDQPYSNQPFTSSAWLEKEQSRGKRSKWIVSLLSFRPAACVFGYRSVAAERTDMPSGRSSALWSPL